MLGTDFEQFFDNGNEVIPALVVFEQQNALPMNKIEKNYGKGEFVSLEFVGSKSKLIEDGLAYEIPGNPGWPEEIIEVMREGIRNARLVCEQLNLTQTVAPKVFFDKSLIKRPELQVFGCSPDKSIYSDGEHRPPTDARKINWRTAGGHIHFSCQQAASFMDQQKLIMGCDMTLGLADVLFEHSDLGRDRRQLYGQPGKFRIQAWGVEYRTPTSVWSVHPEPALEFLKLAEQVHKRTDDGIDWIEIMRKVDFEGILDAIISCDHIKAGSLLSQVCDLSNIKLPDYFDQISQKGGIIGTYGYAVHGW